MRFSSALVFGTLFLFPACAHKPASQGHSDSAELDGIVSEYAESMKRADPYNAPIFDVEEDLDKFGDYPTQAYYDRVKRIYDTAIGKIARVQFAALTEKDKNTYRLFKEDVETGVKQFDFPQSKYVEFNQMGNRLQQYLDDSSQSLTSFPFDSVKHYDAFLKRSEGFPAYVDRQIEILRDGVAKKVVLSCVAARASMNTYKDGLEKDPEKNPFYRPINFMPKTFPEADQQRLKAAYRAMVEERILPGYQKFDEFFRKKYLPHCRSTYGIGSLPDGASWYRYEILSNTNLPLDPKDIHQLGLKEVERISGELEQVKKELGFKGPLREFLKSLTGNPRYFFTSSKDMFNAFEKVKAETAERIPRYFSLVPKSDFKIVETSNPEDAAGRYDNPTENIPYGRFVANTINLRSVPVYGVTTLMLHETVPGHHFQLALQFEMKDKLSEYQRKVYSSNAFVEGWALYAEYLGREMGMYADPLQRLGNLNDELLRAVRLVVDTGIHAFGWTHDKTIAYMRDHLASDAKDIENEANRYSVWPGQALGYKIGQLKIIELRKLAEQELGPKFDIKEFHRVVIGNGTVSLTVLEQQVKDWIAETKHL
jgi:uncharacterized protein (DUF885 family)